MIKNSTSDYSDRTKKIIITFLLILLVVVLFLPGIFKFLRDSKKVRLETEYSEIEEQKRILLHLKSGNERNLNWLEKMHNIMPYFIRICFLIIFIGYDLLMYSVFSKPYSDFLTFSKEVTIYNATLLTFILAVAFVMKGKLFKLEELVESMNSAIYNECFEYYFPKVEIEYNSQTNYKEDIIKRDNRLKEIKIELNEIKSLKNQKRRFS